LNSELKDKINHLPDVAPDHFTGNNEMIHIIQAAKLMNCFRANPGKAEQTGQMSTWRIPK